MPASSFDDTTVAPDSIVSGFGQVGAPLDQAAVVPLPTKLGGISVLIIDSADAERLAGLFVSTDGQVNYHIPAETAEGIATIIVLRCHSSLYVRPSNSARYSLISALFKRAARLVGGNASS